MMNEELEKKVAELEERVEELEKNRVSDRELIEGLNERQELSEKRLSAINIVDLYTLEQRIRNLNIILNQPIMQEILNDGKLETND